MTTMAQTAAPPTSATGGPTATATAPPDVLQSLIREGLSSSDVLDVSRDRKLIEVLFDACIVSPAAAPHPPSQISLEHATLTLDILAQRAARRPEVLLALPPAVDGHGGANGHAPGSAAGALRAGPRLLLYQWLIPRIIHAASKMSQQDNMDDFIGKLLKAALGILGNLSKDLSESSGSYTRGLVRVAHAMRELEAFARAALDGKPSSLFGVADLDASLDAALFALCVIFSAPTLLAQDTVASAVQLLNDARTKLKTAVPRVQARFVRTVETAVRHARVQRGIEVSCLAAVELHIEDERLQQTQIDLLDAISSGQPSVQRAVWSGLLDTLTEEPLASAVGRRVAVYMLTPKPPFIMADTIREHLLTSDTADAWRRHIVTQPGLEQVQQCFEALDRTPEHPSAKRKREPDDEAEQLLEAIWQLVPRLSGDRPPSRLLRDSLKKGPPDVCDKVHAQLLHLVCLAAGCNRSDGPGHRRALNADWIEIWQRSSSTVAAHLSVESLSTVMEHMPETLLQTHLDTHRADRLAMLKLVSAQLAAPSRKERLAAARLFAILYRFRSMHMPGEGKDDGKHFDMLGRLRELLAHKVLPVRETAVLLLGKIGATTASDAFGDILELLILQLGSRSSPLRSLAYTQLLELCAKSKKQPYNLVSQHLDRIGVLLAESLATAPDFVGETMHFIGYTRQAFFSLDDVLKAVLPALVIKRDRHGLELLASILKERLGVILVDQGPAILSKIFLTRASTDASLDFVVKLICDLMEQPIDYDTMLDKYIRASVISFVVTLVIELGDEDPAVSQNAALALQRAHQAESRKAYVASDGADLGAFLKPHMLGVLSAINELLAAPKSTALYRRKIIRSIGKLAELVGDSMAAFSPQIIASLQSTLNEPELREQTLHTWRVYIECLKFSDVGPLIGTTIAALVFSWPSLTAGEQALATHIVRYFCDNSNQLERFKDDIVAFDHLEPLRPLSQQLTQYRTHWNVREYFDKLVERIDSKNIAVSTASMRELRTLLQSRKRDVARLVRGDMFDGGVARLLRSLLGVTGRSTNNDRSSASDREELLALTYACFGILGALDPDRLKSLPAETTMTLNHNFENHDESVDFALHLVRDLLVGAFRATDDTKHQKTLSFAIQELLKFCGFDGRVLRNIANVPPKTRKRWERLPKHILDTVTPLLEAQFMQTQVKTMTFDYPIYPAQRTYRQWVQTWTVDLIGRIMQMKGGGASGDAQAIFGVFNSEPKNQDIGVALHLLPHLVLHVLLSGTPEARVQISTEINSVLLDQVNPAAESTADKRQLAAPVIFDLMDHLSKWLRLQRGGSDRDRAGRSPHGRTVETVLSSIDTQLLANAALKSRAFARSLRNFEQRILQLQREKKSNDDLQPYYENLHEIYAELDEPDGMEGVSASVVSPSLELQIREHESTGRWTSAQSCWEVRLQQSPEDVKLHIGLLKCLRNLGHYDTLRTHIRGVLSLHPDWKDQLIDFETEAAWMIGDWKTVEGNKLKQGAPPLTGVFCALREQRHVAAALDVARKAIGDGIKTDHYARAYEPILDLHMLREIELIHAADVAVHQTATMPGTVGNAKQVARNHCDTLSADLAERFATTLPAFRVREEVLSKRRTAFSLVRTAALRQELGQAWIQSAKIARKAGYEQTAYSAALQAKEADAAYAFIQQAKLTRAQGGTLKALHELEHSLAGLLDRKDRTRQVVDLTGDGVLPEDVYRDDRVLAKAKWMVETDRYQYNSVIAVFKRAIELGDTLESPYYHFGHYYDTLADVAAPEHRPQYLQLVCQNYIEALHFGVKYIYQTMPRLLTIWLDLGEMPDVDKRPDAHKSLDGINRLLKASRGKIATYQFLTAFPQLISRILHPHPKVKEQLVVFIARVIRDYPQQAMWPTVGVMQSKRPERRAAAAMAISRAKAGDKSAALVQIIDGASKLSGVLLQLADDKRDNDKRELSIAATFPYVNAAFPSRMIMPLQDALTCNLPTTAETVQTHRAFAAFGSPVEIAGIEDTISIMPSLQKPKKLTFVGTDGRRYPFLCKPHDDLRKDARLMDFNAMINKFLASASESRRRQLYIRTYAVMPLNEECGLLEWVVHTQALKSILEKGYERQGKKIWSGELYASMEQARKTKNEANLVAVFRDKVLAHYKPTVFHEWFMTTWPEPTAWLAARTAYARTLAVMSMIGFVLGLGDRHGENILFDNTTGDTVHVDLNCLFDKGKTFEIPERVPFRLTHNMVEAMGVTGVEGAFRKASEITMGILRQNSDSLMSVLEAFVHDPLVEWSKARGKEKDVRVHADRSLRPIKNKLRGVMGDAAQQTVPNQVDTLIKEATSMTLLATMYVGWAAWL